MPKGYVVVNVRVTDPERYPEYARQAAETVRRHGGRYLIRAGTPDVREGSPGAERFVVLEFPSLDDARRWYESAEYAPVRALRQRWASSDLFLIEGYAEA